MKQKVKAQTKLIIIGSFLISVVLIVLIAITADRYMKRMSKNNSELYDSYRISELMKTFRTNIIVFENKQQGYVVTGDPRFMETIRQKETEIRANLQSMEKYFTDKPEQPIFRRLKELTNQQLSGAKDLSHNTQGIPQPENEAHAGLKNVDEINATIDEINESLGKTTQTLINNNIEYVQASKSWGLLEIAVGVLAAAIAIIILLRDINLRNQLEHELRKAKKQADNNALMKEQFMANMSHEIRTPMNAILGFAGLMQKTRLDNTQSEYVSAIKTSGSNLLNIINDILDFSKIEAGKLHIEKISFDLLNLIGSLKLMFEEKAEEKRIGLLVDMDKRVPQFIYGDPTRLTQVLVNLLSNAVKFTHKGQVQLFVEPEEINNERVKLSFRVKDSGVGIPAAKHKDVFERFNQGNADTTRLYGGTGLGLSIVKSLVEMQDGDISFTSKENEGTEFKFSITYPVSYEKTQTGTEPKQLIFSSRGGRNLEVLLAEDNVFNQKLASTLLGSFGLEVTVVSNGLEAIDILRKKSFDVILMDIQMPGLDGYHATQKIRNELKLNTPVIAMTAHIMQGELEKCISYGMNDYLSKPFKESELYNVLYKCISGKAEIKTVPLQQGGAGANALDLSELKELAKGNNEFMKEMIEIFLEQNPLDIAQLEAAINENDFEAIQATAHRMKTSVGFIGLKGLINVLSRMEELGSKKENMDDIRLNFGTVKHTSAAASVALQKELKALI